MKVHVSVFQTNPLHLRPPIVLAARSGTAVPVFVRKVRLIRAVPAWTIRQMTVLVVRFGTAAVVNVPAARFGMAASVRQILIVQAKLLAANNVIEQPAGG